MEVDFELLAATFFLGGVLVFFAKVAVGLATNLAFLAGEAAFFAARAASCFRFMRTAIGTSSSLSSLSSCLAAAIGFAVAPLVGSCLTVEEDDEDDAEEDVEEDLMTPFFALEWLSILVGSFLMAALFRSSLSGTSSSLSLSTIFLFWDVLVSAIGTGT